MVRTIVDEIGVCGTGIEAIFDVLTFSFKIVGYKEEYIFRQWFLSVGPEFITVSILIGLDKDGKKKLNSTQSFDLRNKTGLFVEMRGAFPLISGQGTGHSFLGNSSKPYPLS